MSVDDRLRTGLAKNATTFQLEVESNLDKLRASGRRRRATRVAVAAALVAGAAATVLVVALSNAPDQLPPATPDTSPSPTTELFGGYEAEVTRPSRLTGHWVLEFVGNGTVLVTPPDGYTGVVSGTLFTADDTTLRINLFAQDVCSGHDTGEFSWSREGPQLLLETSQDACAARRQFFTENDWVEVSQS
jgi:hypothetical protein